MTVLSKSETVETKGVDETIEYARTALKQGYKVINIKHLWMNNYSVAIEKDDGDKGVMYRRR